LSGGGARALALGSGIGWAACGGAACGGAACGGAACGGAACGGAACRGAGCVVAPDGRPGGRAEAGTDRVVTRVG